MQRHASAERVWAAAARRSGANLLDVNRRALVGRHQLERRRSGSGARRSVHARTRRSPVAQAQRCRCPQLRATRRLGKHPARCSRCLERGSGCRTIPSIAKGQGGPLPDVARTQGPLSAAMTLLTIALKLPLLRGARAALPGRLCGAVWTRRARCPGHKGCQLAAPRAGAPLLELALAVHPRWPRLRWRPLLSRSTQPSPYVLHRLLVLWMDLPGLCLFYGGMLDAKNVVSSCHASACSTIAKPCHAQPASRSSTTCTTACSAAAGSSSSAGVTATHSRP